MRKGEASGRQKSALRETVVLYALMLTYAVFTTIIGAVLSQVLATFALDLSGGGIFASVQNTGCFFGIVLSGILLDRFGKRGLIIVVYAALAIPLLAVVGGGGKFRLLALLFVAGMAAKLLDALLNARIAGLHPAQKGFYLSLLHTCFAVGSLCGPLLAGELLERGFSWRLPYVFLGVACLALLGVYCWLVGGGKTVPEIAPDAGRRDAPASVLETRMLLLCLALFLFGGFEAGMNYWLPTYLATTLAAGTAAAGFGVSLMWLGVIPGRLLASVLSRRLGEKRLVGVGAALASVILAVCLLFAGMNAMYVGMVFAGMLFGATIPMILTLGYTWHPEAQGKVSFLLFISLTLGAVVFPWLVGVFAESVGLRTALLANVALLASLCVIMLSIPSEPPAGTDKELSQV